MYLMLIYGQMLEIVTFVAKILFLFAQNIGFGGNKFADETDTTFQTAVESFPFLKGDI